MKGRNLFKMAVMSCMITVGAVFLAMALAQADTIKIGIIGPLSGPAATWGQSIPQGVEMFIEDLEKAGGLTIQGKNYKLEAISYDDKYNGAEGAKVATRLVQVDKVKFIIGPISSASVAAIQPITERAQVIVLGNSFSKIALSPQHQWYWRVIGTNVETSGALMNYLAKELNIKKVAIISPNDESGKSVGEVDRAFWEKEGVAIVYNEYFERSVKDFYNPFNKIMASGADIIDTSAFPSGTHALIVKQARELGWKKSIVNGTNPDHLVMLDVAGAAAIEDTYAAWSIDSSLPRYNNFKARWEKKHGREFIYPGPLMWYAAADILCQAMRKAQTTTDTVAIKKALDSLGVFETINGKGYFGGKETYGIDRQLIMPVFVKKAMGGKEITVETISPKMP